MPPKKPRNKFSGGTAPEPFDDRLKRRAKELGIRLTDKNKKRKSSDKLMKEILRKINRK